MPAIFRFFPGVSADDIVTSPHSLYLICNILCGISFFLKRTFLSFILPQVFLRKGKVFSKDLSDISMYDVFLELNSII